jgi:phage recombination protein Bet
MDQENCMNAVVKAEESNLPAPVARRGIAEAAWRTAMNSLFPGAKAESVLMVFDYCAARKLDPLKKPCHIVPMQVKNAQTGGYEWRDVVMPGIYEYRITANRTGQYLGHSDPVWGPITECAGVSVPESCKLVVKRWNPDAKMVAEYPAEVFFSECVALKDGKANQRWAKAPRQMLEKCAEAAALRKAFNEELGGTHTAEEMDGQVHSETEVVDITPGAGNPRGDLSDVDWEMRDRHIKDIVDILAADKEEADIAQEMREYVAEALNPYPELYITVLDKLAKDKVITKAAFRKMLEQPRVRE